MPAALPHVPAGTFGRYDFLWRTDLQAEYEAFMRSCPTLEDCEAQLKRIMGVEQVPRAAESQWVAAVPRSCLDGRLGWLPRWQGLWRARLPACLPACLLRTVPDGHGPARPDPPLLYRRRLPSSRRCTTWARCAWTRSR